eukprot:Opistho-1_new@11064
MRLKLIAWEEERVCVQCCWQAREKARCELCVHGILRGGEAVRSRHITRGRGWRLVVSARSPNCEKSQRRNPVEGAQKDAALADHERSPVCLEERQLRQVGHDDRVVHGVDENGRDERVRPQRHFDDDDAEGHQREREHGERIVQRRVVVPGKVPRARGDLVEVAEDDVRPVPHGPHDASQEHRPVDAPVEKHEQRREEHAHPARLLKNRENDPRATAPSFSVAPVARRRGPEVPPRPNKVLVKETGGGGLAGRVYHRVRRITERFSDLVHERRVVRLCGLGRHRKAVLQRAAENGNEVADKEDDGRGEIDERGEVLEEAPSEHVRNERRENGRYAPDRLEQRDDNVAVERAPRRLHVVDHDEPTEGDRVQEIHREDVRDKRRLHVREHVQVPLACADAVLAFRALLLIGLALPVSQEGENGHNNKEDKNGHEDPYQLVRRLRACALDTHS